METAGQIFVDIDGNLIPLGRALNTALDNAQKGGAKAGEGFGSHFAIGFQSRALNAIGAINEVLEGARTIAQTAGTVTGVGIAAQYERLEVGFKGLLGSGRAARDIMDELAKKGAQTPFDTAGLTATARGLIAVGVEARNVTRDVGAIADAVAIAGGENPELAEMGRMLQMLRVRPHPELESLGAIAARGVDLDKVVGAATGKTYSTGGGIQALQQMTGAQAYDTIIAGFQKTYGGAAAGQAGGTLSGITANAQESLQLAMKPTGELLLPALKTTTGLLVETGNAFQHLNELTGGSAGLIVSVGGGVLAFRYLGGVAKEATAATTAAAAAVKTLAGAAEQLTVAAGAATVGEEAEAAAKKVAAVTNVGSSAAAAGTGLAGAGGAAAIGKSLIGILPLLIPIIASSLIGYSYEKFQEANKDNPKAQMAVDVGKSAAAGAAIGGTALGILGSVVPGFGTLAGAIAGTGIGTAIGTAIGVYQVSQKSKNGDYGETAAQRTAKATEETAAQLKKLSLGVFGGGERIRGNLRSLEMEYTVQRAMKTKVG